MAADWDKRREDLRRETRASAGRLGDVPRDWRRAFAPALREGSKASREWRRVFDWLEGKPDGLHPGIPILLYRTHSSSGLVGFASEDDPGSPPSRADGTLRMSFNAGLELARSALPVLPKRADPDFHFDLCEATDGGSAGLSGFLAGLFHALDLPFPRRWAATGAVEGGSLAPLSAGPATLAAKAAAARDFGFTVLLLVEGSPAFGLPRGMERVDLPAEPGKAVAAVLARLFREEAYANRPLSTLFFLMDRHARSQAQAVADSGLVLAAARQAGENGFFANLVRGHALLHLGRSAEAGASMAKARTLKATIDLFDHPFQSYIAWESLAKDAVCWLDNGRLSPGDPLHAPLVAADATLEGVFAATPTSPLAYARLCVGNTLAMLFEFQGRLDEDHGMLDQALRLRWRLRAHWPAVFAHDAAQQPGASPTDGWRRQHNYLVDTIYSQWLCGVPAGACANRLRRVEEAFAGRMGRVADDGKSFDLVAVAKKAALTGRLRRDEGVARDLLRRWSAVADDKRHGYPAIRVPELLGWHCPWPWAREAAAAAVAASGLGEDPGRIDCLLRCRGGAVLLRLGDAARGKAMSRCRSPLFRALRRRMGGTAEEIHRRCPY